MTLLFEQEKLCVCDFVRALGQTRWESHLRYLYNAGLVEDRREGLWMHYRISTKLGPAQAKVLAALSQAVGDERRRELCAALEHWFAQKEATGECQAPAATPCC
jgi:DNA-binding transcriptional ArsR family regulator